MTTIEDMTSDVALKFLETVKELTPQQKQFLELALKYYQEYAASGVAVSGKERVR